ncbi:MAG: DUF2914 domain-containing protein [Acidobacteria bacterium]|nr:DUF2914 domain-containing protein [Acidobacteriota bacterium]
MSRMFQVLVLTLVVLAASANAAEVVSMKLCAVADYDASSRDCAPGKALEGSNIMLDPTIVQSLYFLTAVKSAEAGEIYHVWIADGKTSGRITVYEAASRTMREATQEELDWLKDRNIEGAQALVKLSVSASPGYRTRSQKTFTTRNAGPWKVQVYDSTSLAPLGEMSFTITASASTTTEQD